MSTLLPDFGPLRDPVLLAAFDGWNDAGEAATGALDHLAAEWDAEVVWELDPEDYYDYQVNRPTVHSEDDGMRIVDWPNARVLLSRLPGSETAAARDVLILRAPEPSMRWRSFCNELLGLARKVELTTGVTLGALLADTPHTHPVPVTGSAGDPEVARKMGLEMSRYEGPTGIVGVLQHSLQTVGIPAVSLWAAVPHYVSQQPCPKATLALLRRLEDLLDHPLPTGDLQEQALAWQLGADRLAAEDPEVGDYVRQLEANRSPEDVPEASGEAIAREFERYLRQRPDEQR